MRSLLGHLATLGWGLLALVGVAALISAGGEIIGGHDDPSLAGKGRLHDPFIVDVKCNRGPEICDRDKTVKLDLPNGETEDVTQDSLYDLVEREGPVTVEVEWVKDLESATRVRYEDRWYRASYPKYGAIFGSIFGVVVGLVLIFFGGLFFLGRVLPDADPEDEAGADSEAEPDPGSETEPETDSEAETEAELPDPEPEPV